MMGVQIPRVITKTQGDIDEFILNLIKETVQTEIRTPSKQLLSSRFAQENNKLMKYQTFVL